jgi:VanZ family protein
LSQTGVTVQQTVQQRDDAEAVPGAYQLLLVTIGLIVYGSLYPWKFGAASQSGSPILFLLHSWPKTFDRFLFVDCVINVLLYAPLGMLAYLAFMRRGRKWAAVAGALGLGLTLSVCIELLQQFDPGRVSSLQDVASNGAGTAAGIGAAWVLQALLRRLIRLVGESPLVRWSAAVMLVLGWAAYQGIPFYPAISRTQLRTKLRDLASPATFSPLDTLVVFAEWMAIACVIESVVGERWARRVVPVLWLLVPARILIEERSFTWAELGGAAMACMVWRLLPLRHLDKVRVTAGVLAVTLLVNGLAPFHFGSSAATFSWIPLRGFLESETLSGMMIFLRKCFWYGAAIWLGREAGVRLALATGVTAVMLAAIEAAQIYLPGRTAEVSDPLLALLLGLSIWLADRHRSGARHGGAASSA